MSYLQNQGMGKNKTYAIAAVVILHLLLGYMMISGLAVKAVRVITGPIEVKQVDEEPQDVEEPPPPPENLEEIPPYVPPPDVVIETQTVPTDTISATTQLPPPPRAPVVAPPPPPPAPAAPRVAPTPPQPRGSTVSISQDDYPAASVRAQEEGRSTIKVIVDEKGRVSSCQVVRSSGHERLDERACQVAQRRWRFKPATEDGKPVTSSYTQNVTWQIR